VQQQVLASSPLACSRPLDLDDLNARLRLVPTDDSFSLGPEPQSIEPLEPTTPPFDVEAFITSLDVEAYHELTKDGGRPLYPIELILDVYRNPNNFAETLRPWQESLESIRSEDIFIRQLRRWQNFRKWQNDNRGREDDDGGYLGYVERMKHIFKQDLIPTARDSYLAEIEADPLCLESDWDTVQWKRERQRY
jgi:hypothetical protein